MPHLNIYLLGAPRFVADNIPVTLGRRKATALLAYLTINNQPHTRDTLATLLWPDYGQTNARTALRQTLNMLKAAFGENRLQVDRETVALPADDTIWSDTRQFLTLKAERHKHGHSDDITCEKCASALTGVVEVYLGNFMEGFSLRDSINFDEWQFYEAEQFRSSFREALNRLIRVASTQRDFQT